MPWRSQRPVALPKHQSVYVRELADSRDATCEISASFRFYNEVRTHSSLDGRTSREVYLGWISEAA